MKIWSYFSDPARDVAVATNFVGKSTSNTHLVVRMTFARAAQPAYDKKSNCCAVSRQTDYLTRWTQVSQLTDQLTITTDGEEDTPVGYRQALLASSFETSVTLADDSVV